MGPIGKEFAALSRLMMTRDGSPTLMQGYLQQLAKVRTRFNQIQTQGDPGPSARQMMGATLDAGQSELADALKFVDEQMLVGMSDSAKGTLRPLLVRPLMQSLAVIVQPTETEINRVWAAQVLEPFQRTLAGKYPFDGSSRVEASPAEIAKVFGPSGSIARFSTEALATLVVRRGDTITARTWADMGLRLRPDFQQGFAQWVAPLDGSAPSGDGAGGAAAAAAQTVFQVLPQGAPGLLEYTIEIDGQSLRYRNTAPAWTNFVWPNPQGAPGVRISAVTVDGRTVEIVNEPGRFGLTRLFELAQRRRLNDNANELSWSAQGKTVSVQLRVVSQPGAEASSTAQAQAGGGIAALRNLQLPALVAGGEGAAALTLAPTAAGPGASAASAGALAGSAP